MIFSIETETWNSVLIDPIEDGYYLVKGTETHRIFRNSFPSGSISIKEFKQHARFEKNKGWFVDNLPCFTNIETSNGYIIFGISEWRDNNAL